MLKSSLLCYLIAISNLRLGVVVVVSVSGCCFKHMMRTTDQRLNYGHFVAPPHPYVGMPLRIEILNRSKQLMAHW